MHIAKKLPKLDAGQAKSKNSSTKDASSILVTLSLFIYRSQLVYTFINITDDIQVIACINYFILL